MALFNMQFCANKLVQIHNDEIFRLSLFVISTVLSFLFAFRKSVKGKVIKMMTTILKCYFNLRQPL